MASQWQLANEPTDDSRDGYAANIDKKMVVAGIVFLCAFRDGDDSVTSSLTLGRGGAVAVVRTAGFASIDSAGRFVLSFHDPARLIGW
jgi:hypothetical protein